jgi:hypothetical protein
MTPIAENLWIQNYHLPLLGTEQGRVVTVIRLRTGRLVIHSTAPFAVEDVREIARLGEPGWLVEAMLLHDTFAKEGRAAFPGIPYLAPEKFAGVAKVDSRPLLPAPEEWQGELEVLRIDGAPKLDEHVFFHSPTRTLIVADFVFNFEGKGTAWERFFRRWAIGLKHEPNMSRVFRALVSDREAFQKSVAKVMEWDFDRVIVGHKEVIPSAGKVKVQRALIDAGLG